MDTAVGFANPLVPAARPELFALKTRQRAAWAAGDYSLVGTTLQIVGEQLCESLDLRAGRKVLDVAAGNGNASLAAARRWCDVVSTDYVPSLLERARQRAAAERLSIRFREADAEALPFADATFDAVVSTFGVMFAPDQERAAAELLRVCKPGGRIGLASWTPDSFIGHVFQAVSRYVPPLSGAKSPAFWGTRSGIKALFGEAGASASIVPRAFMLRYRSPEHWLQVFRSFYGPVMKAFDALDMTTQAQLQRDLLMLVEKFNQSGDRFMVTPSEYLEVVITRP